MYAPIDQEERQPPKSHFDKKGIICLCSDVSAAKFFGAASEFLTARLISLRRVRQEPAFKSNEMTFAVQKRLLTISVIGYEAPGTSIAQMRLLQKRQTSASLLIISAQ